MPTLHVHLDEAGNWAFSPKGSAYYILTAAWTFDPQPLAAALTDLRFQFIKQGLGIEGFHAAPDRQITRDAVVQTMLANAGWRFGAVVMEKRKINPSLYPPHRFYPTFAGALLRFVLSGPRAANTSSVLVYADTLPMDTRAKQEGVLKAIKTACKDRLPSTPSHSFSHCHESNPWIQVADYCCWSVQRKWEKKDTRTYDLLRPKLQAAELVITDNGNGITYY